LVSKVQRRGKGGDEKVNHYTIYDRAALGRNTVDKVKKRARKLQKKSRP